MSSNSNAHDALTELGYSITDTGGGVEQYLWVHEPSGGYRIITSEVDEQPESLDEPVFVGIYDEAGAQTQYLPYASLREALADEQRPS